MLIDKENPQGLKDFNFPNNWRPENSGDHNQDLINQNLQIQNLGSSNHFLRYESKCNQEIPNQFRGVEKPTDYLDTDSNINISSVNNPEPFIFGIFGNQSQGKFYNNFCNKRASNLNQINQKHCIPYNNFNNFGAQSKFDEARRNLSKPNNSFSTELIDIPNNNQNDDSKSIVEKINKSSEQAYYSFQETLKSNFNYSKLYKVSIK